MRLVFLGSPEPVLAPLKMLVERAKEHGHELVGVVSQPAKPVGRKAELTDPPVAAWAKARGIPTLQPVKAGDAAFLRAFAELAPDVAITAAYGQILTNDFLAIPKRGTINIHPSLLPRYRGAIPIPAALLDGLKETGCTILFTVQKLDAGNLIAQEPLPIAPDDTTATLTAKGFQLGAEMLFGALAQLRDPKFAGIPQDDALVTHCKKIRKEDGLVDWTQPAPVLLDRFRAFQPWPGTFTYHAGRRITITALQLEPSAKRLAPGAVEYAKAEKLLHVGTGQGALGIAKLKPAGGKEIDAAGFWNGLKDKSQVAFATPIVVAVSGGGRTLENLLAREKRGSESFVVAGVVASREDCRGVTLAREAKIPVFIGNFSIKNHAELRQPLAAFLRETNARWIVLAGFLKPWPVDAAWSQRIVNIHPALLPCHGGAGMYGDRVHAAVLQAGDAETGATVHYVTEKYDEGAVIAQARVPVLAGDDTHALAARVFAAESELYPATLNKLIRGEIK